MTSLFVDQLTIADFSYLHAKRGLLGESWVVDLELSGEPDSQGFILDFGIVKKDVKKWIDTYVDHRLLVPGDDRRLVVNQTSTRIDLRYQSEVGLIETKCPSDAICVIPSTKINIESVTDYIQRGLREILPYNITQIDVTLREEEIRGPYYHYSHGLKKHDGNCRRIAHGHRSKIQVYENDQYSDEWSIYWSQKLQDIYIGTESDIVSEADGYTTFFYRTDDGEFELKIPSRTVYLINTDSSVENIAQHLATKTRELIGSQSSVKVRAFEGINKGSTYNVF